MQSKPRSHWRAVNKYFPRQQNLSVDSKGGIGEGFAQAADPRFQTVDPTGAIMAVARCLFLSEDDARSFRQRPGHMVAFEFAVECRAFDAEDHFRFVPAGMFPRGEVILLLDIGHGEFTVLAGTAAIG